MGRHRRVDRPTFMKAWADGTPIGVLEQKFNAKRNTLYSIVQEERQAGNPLAYYRRAANSSFTSISLPEDIQLMYDVEAWRRKTSTPALINSLLTTIAKDKMFNAVLDD